MSERYCKVCDGWHDLAEPWPAACYKPRTDKRSSLPAPMLNLDTMDPVQSQVDGKLYDSKATLRATYKAAGVVEVGNDQARNKPFKRKPIDTKANVEAIQKARAKVDRGQYTEATKRKHA